MKLKARKRLLRRTVRELTEQKAPPTVQPEVAISAGGRMHVDGPQGVMRLQRLVGNRIVTQALRPPAQRAAEPCTECGEQVQRQGGTTATPTALDLDASETEGGHCLARHVNVDDDYLRNRLATSGITAASRFKDKSAAQAAVDAVLAAKATEVAAWQSAGSSPKQAFSAAVADAGLTITRAAYTADHNCAPEETTRVTVVLKKKGSKIVVLTAFPEK